MDLAIIAALIYLYGFLACAYGALSRRGIKKKYLQLRRAVLWPIGIVLKLEKMMREALRRGAL